MKKIIFLLMLAANLLLLSACASEPEEQIVHFSTEEGKQIVTQFLTAVVKGDKIGAEKDLSTNAKAAYSQLAEGFKGAGFIILEANELNAGAEYHGKLFENEESIPYHATYDFLVTMEKIQGDYVISKLSVKKELVIKLKDGSLIADENGTETALLSLNDVPAQASPKAAPEKLIAVDKKAFGPIALSADKRILLFAVNGLHGFLGSYNLDSREITTQDIYSESKITRINWSPDGNLYGVEKLNPTSHKEVIIYDAMAENIYPFPGGDIFKDPKFSISRPLFLENNFYFHVKADKNKTVSGWWVYNFNKRKLGKLLK